MIQNLNRIYLSVYLRSSISIYISPEKSFNRYLAKYPRILCSKIRKQPVRILFPSSKHAVPCTCACYKECQKSQNRHRFSRLPGRQISRRQQAEQEPCRHRSQDRRQNSISGMLLIREFNFSLFHVFLQILPGGAVHNPDILPEYSASDHPHHSFLPAAQAVKVR